MSSTGGPLILEGTEGDNLDSLRTPTKYEPPTQVSTSVKGLMIMKTEDGELVEPRPVQAKTTKPRKAAPHIQNTRLTHYHLSKSNRALLAKALAGLSECGLCERAGDLKSLRRQAPTM